MKKALKVTLAVREPSVVELTTEDHVQLDRVVSTPYGAVAERSGALLQPGVTRLALDQGVYFFKTLSDANLKVVYGGVDATADGAAKSGWPDPPVGVYDAGDDLPGDGPQLTIE